MAAEPLRGCGYRRIGGLYLVGGGVGIPCDRLPLILYVCPTCSHGIKPARGFTWVDVNALVEGKHLVQKWAETTGDQIHRDIKDLSIVPCPETGCIFCREPALMGRAGLLWIGEQFYPTPDLFLAEGRALGFSRRIKSVPRGFKLGETYVLLAHSKAVLKLTPDKLPGTDILIHSDKHEWKPGIFYVWLPTRLELIFKESDRGSEKVADAEKRGITPVFFPSDDVDHQGNLFEKD